ncbi:hypothetical protein PM082_004865 [Marasmius tenuissimus]|nr:hypothetical protein PM082_004865 [Marasmius tenuissimus]
MPDILANAHNTTIGNNANFQTVARDVITNHYHSPERGDLMTVNGRTVRRLIDGDIIYRRLLWSKVLSVEVRHGESTTSELQVFKVKKTVQAAKIVGFQEEFTATTLELINEEDRAEFVKLVKKVLEAAMCRRSALLTQLFAVAESDALTMIVHDELANGIEFAGRYWQKNSIVFYYISYTHLVATESLRDDEAVTFPVANRWEGWSFNAKSLTWIYDPASVLLNPPSEEELEPLEPLLPLRQETPPRLDTAEIVACVERNFGDVLHLAVPSIHRWIDDLSNFTLHGLLTFGSIVNWNRGIVAHFPSFPSPKWSCDSLNPNVKASFSRSVPWRVDLAFRKTGDVLQVTLELGLRIPENDRNRLRCACLCQSLDFSDNSDNVGYVAYVDEIGFYLEGTFLNDPTSLPIPTYLFFPPLPTEFINNTHCIRYPFPENLFYWSHDPQGRTAIAEEDWEKFGIPELSVEEWMGSGWQDGYYAFVRDHLYSGSYELDGKQYARDHGYPELIHADPHDTVGLEEPITSPSQLTFPSASSLDFLDLIASFGGRLEGSLSKFASHGILTFGAVVDYHNHETLAYLPSSPRPEWFFKSVNPDVKAICSISVPWRVDLTHRKAGNVRVTLEFGLRIPDEHCNQLGAAYLCQFVPFYDISNDPSHVVFINQVGFRLTGTFLEEPAERAPPAYLFVPPFRTKLINNMHCVLLPRGVFYWSHNSQGRDAIPEEDWGRFGIPELTVEEWIGSNWEEEDYVALREHRDSLDYDLDGQQYAYEHGYPELLAGDPHNIKDLGYSDSKLGFPPSPSRSQLTSPSSLLIVEEHTESQRNPEHEDTPAIPIEGEDTSNHWAKRGFLNKWYNSVLETVTQADTLEHSVVMC